jgi:hypothetical protein
VMSFSHEACMVVSRRVVSLGSFPSSMLAGRSRVALRVSREARREVLGPDLSPFGVIWPLLRWWVGNAVYSLH